MVLDPVFRAVGPYTIMINVDGVFSHMACERCLCKQSFGHAVSCPHYEAERKHCCRGRLLDGCIAHTEDCPSLVE